jgi:protein-disulfide isomerase
MRSVSPIVYLALLIPSLAAPPCASAQTTEIKPEQCLGGSADAPILIEVFSDFECAHCREFYLNTIPLVLKEYCSLNKVCVVYHEFPLPSNMYSRRAAQYSKAAQKLGREQWRNVMVALYENQEKWSQSGSVDDVVSNALAPDDYSQLKKLLKDSSIDAAIKNEIAIGEKKKVTATPTLFVYAIGREQKVVGSIAYPILKNFFDSIVK